MAMNTEYLSNDTTVFSKLSVSGAATLGAVETASAASFGAVTGTTIAGTTLSGSKISSTVATGGGIYSAGTTATSVFTTLISDQELSIVSVSATSAALVWRSGSTAYLFLADSAQGLSTTP